VSAPTSEQKAPTGIVVGVDGSPTSELALRWALAQARSTGQELHAIVAWDIPVAYDAPLLVDYDWSGEAAGSLRTTVANTAGEPEASRVVQHVTRGHPARVLLDAARGADLLVVGCRGHGGFAGTLLGSVSQHVLGRAPCPVAVVHEKGTPTGRIVVGVDGSPQSEDALRWAAAQASRAHAELRAVLAWELPLGYGLTVRPETDWAAHGAALLDATVRRALEERDAAGVVQEVVEGSPAGELLRAAEDADLLVVGSRGRGGFAGMLLGSVSRHVAAHATCPVVVDRR
jgi:nucleotide-binding universal stress UspA family protein